MNGGGLLHTTLTSSASAQGARVSLKSTARGSEDATPNTQISLSFEKKRRVTMRVLLTSVTIELGVKATTFDEER